MTGNVGFLAAGLGAGLAVIGLGYGVGRIGASAMDGVARQPAAASDIRTSMLLAAGFVEGGALFAILVSLMMLFR